MQFNRTGNMSVYGDVKVIHVSRQGVNTLVGEAKGVSVYTPNSKRIFIINLDKAMGVDFHEGKIKVEYATQPEPKSEMIAGAYLKLN